ncbi:MAG TPA: hypothetical protein PLA71_04260 [Saccharofermentans sp.]|nr:hypothetical protein [Saccharofermentans sp.]
METNKYHQEPRIQNMINQLSNLADKHGEPPDPDPDDEHIIRSKYGDNLIIQYIPGDGLYFIVSTSDLGAEEIVIDVHDAKDLEKIGTIIAKAIFGKAIGLLQEE